MNACGTRAIGRSAGFSTSFIIASWRCSIARGRRRSRTSIATARDDDHFAVYIGRVPRHLAGSVPRSRHAARPGQVLSRRRARPAGTQRGGARRDPPAFLSRARGARAVRRPLDVAWRSGADLPRGRRRRARDRRRARRPCMGSAAQVPDPGRAADAQSIRELSARRHAARESSSTGCASTAASSSIGTYACCCGGTRCRR